MATGPQKHWYRPRAQDYVCNAHPRVEKQVVRDFARAIGMSEVNARHMIDRLRHLTTCCREPEQITLMRILPGERQTRQPTELEQEAAWKAEQAAARDDA